MKSVNTTMLKNILFVNILLDSLGWSVIIPSLPNIHEILGLNTVAIGSMYSAISLLAFLSSTMQGIMLDYFGTQKMLYLSPISQLIGFSMIIVSIQLKSFPLFAIGRCLPAFFKCGMVVSQAVLYDLSGPESIRDFGALFAFSNIAYIIGPVVGGFIYSLHPFAPYITSMITASLSILLLFCIPAKQDTFRRTASMEKIETKQTTTTIKETPDKATPPSSTWKNPALFYYLHIKFAFQIGIATFEAFFGQYSRTYAGLNSRSIGLILGLYGTLALFTNLYIIKGLLSIISPKKLEFFFIPLILVLGTSLSIWSQTKSLTVVLFAVSILSVAGNLFQLIVQNRIASTQEVEIPIRTTIPVRPDDSLIRMPSNEEIPLDKEIIVEEPVVVSQQKEKKSEKQKTIGAVFGMSAAADRAARIVSPMIGSFFLQLYGSNGIFFVASLITVYCVCIVFYTSPLKFLSLFDSHEESLLSVSKKID
jgi:MFS family permease